MDSDSDLNPDVYQSNIPFTIKLPSWAFYGQLDSNPDSDSKQLDSDSESRKKGMDSDSAGFGFMVPGFGPDLRCLDSHITGHNGWTINYLERERKILK